MSRKLEVINKLAMDIVNDTTESYRNADFNARKIVMLAQPRDLNDNQQIVLDWMEKEYKRIGESSLIAVIYLVHFENRKTTAEHREMWEAYRELTAIEEAEVLQAFVEWETRK